MTIKLLLLKSGEDIIADVAEMAMGDVDDPKNPRRIIGYYLNKPCVIKMRDPRELDQDGREHKTGYAVSLFPWMPLAKEERIPIPADWMITMVEPVTKLEEMYLEDVVNYGQSNKDTSTDESTESD
tara:strand:- start:247 stop:624 length:378 start_codon:yes stop_codon:yes gene_type:complete